MTADRSDSDPDTPPIIEFDHYSPEYRDNWRAISDDLLSRCPVSRSTTYGGFLVMANHQHVSTVIRDDVTFSSVHSFDADDPRDGVVIPPNPMPQLPIELDPPEYNAHRKLLNPFFSPTAARQWESFTQQATDACLDTAVESGRIDFVLDLANPVPALLTMKMMGLPMDGWRAYAEASHGVVANPAGSPEYLAAMNGLAQLGGSLAGELPRLRAEGADGVLGALLRAEVNGRALTDEELVSIAIMVTQGGVDTATSLVADTLYWLWEHPDQRRRLIADPELIVTATDEFLRYFSPVPALARTAVADTEIGGCPVASGDRVLMSFSAANRDPAMFADPGELDMDRDASRHLAFGQGIHRCIGQHIARMEFQVMLRSILARMPDYVIDADATHRNPSIGITNGFAVMPATFTPSTPTGATLPA